MTSIFIRTILIYITLSIMLKLMGKRQIGELEVNELVSTLLISEIAALPISDTSIPLLPSIIPIVFVTSVVIIVSILKNKSNALKEAVEGTPAYIIYKGRLLQKALADNRISVNEMLTEMRTQGIPGLECVSYAILEQNGKLSFLKTSDSPNITTALVIDTKPQKNSLRAAGLDMEWLLKRLRERNVRLEDVFLMTVNENGDINLIEKEKKQ